MQSVVNGTVTDWILHALPPSVLLIDPGWVNHHISRSRPLEVGCP